MNGGHQLLVPKESFGDSDALEPEPEPQGLVQPPSSDSFSADNHFGTGPDGRPVFIGADGLDGVSAGAMDDLTRLAPSAGVRRYEVRRRAAVSAGLDLLSQEKGHLIIGEVIEAVEVTVYAGRARVRFPPPSEGRPGGWSSVRSGGGRELLRLMGEGEGSGTNRLLSEWATARERATQLLAVTHGLRDALALAVLERPLAAPDAPELTDDEWFEAICATGSKELGDLAELAEQKLEMCATVDETLESASAASARKQSQPQRDVQGRF